MKRCTKCKEEKDDSSFPVCSRLPGGRLARCKTCINQLNRTYREQNKEAFGIARKAHYKKNVVRMRKQKSNYAANHRSDKAAYDALYRSQNSDKIRAYKKNWENQKREEVEFKLKRNLRRRVHHVLKGHSKSARTFDLIGCSLQEFIHHIESQFTSGMSWENYGTHGWHIDHIIPCCQFDLTIASHQRQCFHYSNQRPLWAEENLKKGKRLDTPRVLAVESTAISQLPDQVLPQQHTR